MSAPSPASSCRSRSRWPPSCIASASSAANVPSSSRSSSEGWYSRSSGSSANIWSTPPSGAPAAASIPFGAPSSFRFFARGPSSPSLAPSKDSARVWT